MTFIYYYGSHETDRHLIKTDLFYLYYNIAAKMWRTARLCRCTVTAAALHGLCTGSALSPELIANCMRQRQPQSHRCSIGVHRSEPLNTSPLSSSRIDFWLFADDIWHLSDPSLGVITLGSSLGFVLSVALICSKSEGIYLFCCFWKQRIVRSLRPISVGRTERSHH